MRIDTDPLGAIRKELVGAARRRAAARRRRRRAVTAAATAMMTVVAVAGTGVATGLGPDLGALQSALDSLVSLNRDAPPPDPEARILGEEEVPRIPDVPELSLGTHDRSEVVELPSGDSAEPAFALAFVGGIGEVCYSVAVPDPQKSGMVHANLACDAAVRASREAHDVGARFANLVTTEQGLVLGAYVSPDVQQATVTGPLGEADVELTEPWQPPVKGAEPVRVLVAIQYVDPADRTVDNGALDFTAYRLRLEFSDGRVAERGFLRGGGS